MSERPRGGAIRGRGRSRGQAHSPFYVPRNPDPYSQNPYFQNPPYFNPGRFVTREMVEAAVAKAQSDLLSVGENISAWKVSQSVALALQVNSWDSLGFRFSDLPYLRDLQFVEGKVNAFIHSFVSVRRMTSVYELGLEICKSEGVEEFGELGLGPLLRHTLVRQYFVIPPDLKEVCSITIDDLMLSLSTFLYRVKNKEFTVEEFLDFLVKKYSVPARENLGVRIQSMGLYIKFIKGARRAESAALRSIQERDLLKEQSDGQTYSVSDDYLGETSKEVGSSDVCIIDVVSSKKCCQCCPSQKRKSKKHGGCKCTCLPYIDEVNLIGIKLAMFNHVSSGKLLVNSGGTSESYGAASYEIMKINLMKANQLILSTNQIDSFIATWKGACQKHSADEVLAMMLNIYTGSDKQKRKMQRLFFLYPAVGLLNLAVRVLKGEILDVFDHASSKLSSVYQNSSLHMELAKSELSDNDPMSDEKNCVENVDKS